MHADTDAIRSYGRTTSDLSTDLQAAVAVLSRDLGPTVADALGPIGARFARALTSAADALVADVSRIADDMVAHGTAAATAAGHYDDVEARARDQVARVAI